ncbi:hypothetical protein TNCV_3721051 [Trichonephila clavipes]|nr:hypothetical protein TNCV_3721051 [Trichonephila clavipes]
MGFSRQTLGSSYLTTSNDSGASIGAARRIAAMPQQLIDTLILSMGRRCETCLAVELALTKEKPPGQPIGVNDHFTKHPTREQPLSSQSCLKTSKISHPDEAR